MAAKALCAVDGCDKPSRCRRLCNTHYARFRIHGEAGGPIGTSPGEPMRFLKDVVLNFEGDDCLIWPFSRNAGGYGQVWCDQRVQLATRLVCEWVYGKSPSERHVAAHRCGQGHTGCVSKKHLYWATQKQNIADARRHGTIVRGEQTRSAKVSERDVKYIRQMRGKVFQKDLAEKFGLHQSQVSLIQSGKNWGWLKE